MSAVDEFVTDVEPIDATSLPTESCTALASSPAVGSVYVNVTVCPDSMVGVVPSTMLEPDTVTDVGERAIPSTTTEKLAATAVVADNASENVNVTVVPAAFVAADTNAGAVVSTVAKFQVVPAVRPPYVLLKLSLKAPASIET